MSDLSANEHIKAQSRQLRGGIAAGLEVAAHGGISDADQQLIKFHGIYQQDDRDLRGERAGKFLDKAYSFMVRLRLPGGELTTAQWLALDALAGARGNGTLRLTTRQSVQFHGIIKSNLRPAIGAIHAALLDSIAACGDVNRNVIASVAPQFPAARQEVLALSRRISAHLLPRSQAWHEIWVDGAPQAGQTELEAEPILGQTYLPRKFKIAIAVPPCNDTDVFAHDIGLIAILVAGKVAGYDVVVGGGMGRSRGDDATYARLAEPIGFCTPDRVVDLCEKIVTIQRDWGDRAVRGQARLKYTIARRGLGAFVAELEQRLGWRLAPARGAQFSHGGDPVGWVGDAAGGWHRFLFVENGRIEGALRAALGDVARAHAGRFIVTANQNLVIADVAEPDKARIEALLGAAGPAPGPLRRHAMACVALPTCPLALAESERALPGLIGALEAAATAAGLGGREITIRMTGCPNGCARPYLAEIALVGTGPGRYDLFLGGAADGTRLARLHAPAQPAARIMDMLGALFAACAADGRAGEGFGDFLLRTGRIGATSPDAAPADLTAA